MSRDRIEIGGLRVLGTHGVLPEEQDRCQPFELDLAIEADLAAAGASDDLALTLDYGDLVETARRVVSSSRFQLLEALAEAVASAILEDVRVEAVTVGLRKLRPPLAADVSTVGVRLTREQSSHAGESVARG